MHLDAKTKKLISDPDKRRAWVIYQLKLLGKNLASVARDAGVTKQQTQVAMGRPYPRMERFIANALGLAPQELFPERYDTDGLPNRHRGRPAQKSSVQHTSDDRRRNVHTQRAA